MGIGKLLYNPDERIWFNIKKDGYGTPPDNFLPERPILEPAKLNKDVVNRLIPFGYKYEDTIQAFSDPRPHPIKNTYYLLCEMLQREEKRRREDRRKNAFKTTDTSVSTSSLYSIDEDSPIKQPPSISPVSEQSKKEQYKAFGSMPNALDQVPNSRRTSTPAGILSSFIKNTSNSAKKQQPQMSETVEEPQPSPPAIDEAQRRASMSVISQPAPSTPTGGKPDEIREVHGWFFNVATTSRKSRDEIISEIKRVLAMNNLAPRMTNGPNIVTCIDLNPDSGSNQLEFEIEICKVPNLSLLGLHFRRVNGSLWQYKKICGKLLSQMNL